MSQLQEIIKEFLRYMRIERDASVLTIQSYRSDLRPLEDFLIRERIWPELEYLTTPVLRRYFLWMQETRNLKSSTLRRRIHSFKSFFAYCLDQEYIDRNPMNKIRAPGKPDIIPIFLKDEELDRLLRSPDLLGGAFRLRDKVALYILAYCGLRRAELMRLDWDDADLGAARLHVRGKGKKERFVPLIAEVRELLWEYLQSRLPLTNRALFLSRHGNRANTDVLSRLFRKHVQIAGLDPKVITPHKLRHTFASRLAERDVNLFVLQELLGHADLGSTRIYSHCSTQKLHDAVELIRPKHPDV